MAETNPYQAPTEGPLVLTDEYVLIAKSFNYGESPESKGVNFHGAIVAGSDGLVLCHDKHSYQSTTTVMAVFGLIGLAIQAFMNRNRTIDYPYTVLPVDEVPDGVRERFAGHKFKPKSVIAVIPRSSITSYKMGMLSKKFMLDNGTELNILAAVNKGMKRLPELGYEEH